MKLTMFKGLAHDLAGNLDFMIFSGQLSKMIDFPIERQVLEQKDEFDKYCVRFFKDRLPENFDFTRVKNILVKIRRSAMMSSVKVEVKVDDKTFSSAIGQI